MSHQTFNKKSYGFLLYILYCFFSAFPYTSVDMLVQAKQSTKWQTYMKSRWICMPSATLRTFQRSRIYSTHPLHIWTSKLVSAIVANELCKTSKHKWFLSFVLQLSRCSKLIAYMNLIKRLCFQMPLRPLLARMPSSHRSCSPLHSLFGAEHTGQNMA